MGPKGKQLLSSASGQWTPLMREGFTHPFKSEKMDQNTRQTPILTNNRYETLAGATAVAGPSGVSELNSPTPRPKQMPPIMAKVGKVYTSLINAIKA